jgi:putative ABC transport system permease protein
MVMKRNKAWSKHKRREIKNSFARYITIFTIVAIGVGFFSGVRISRTAMIQTANTYITEHAMYDFRLLSTLGFTQEDVDAVRNIEGVVHAEGGYTLDILGKHENEVTEVLKVHSLPAYISLPTLLAGEMPSESDECLVDDLNYTKEDIGKTIVFGVFSTKI